MYNQSLWNILVLVLGLAHIANSYRIVSGVMGDQQDDNNRAVGTNTRLSDKFTTQDSAYFNLDNVHTILDKLNNEDAIPDTTNLSKDAMIESRRRRGTRGTRKSRTSRCIQQDRISAELCKQGIIFGSTLEEMCQKFMRYYNKGCKRWNSKRKNIESRNEDPASEFTSAYRIYVL